MNDLLSIENRTCSEQITSQDSASTPLREIVCRMIDSYLLLLDGQPAQKLHDLVIKEVELGLFKAVLQRTGGNQSKAAEWLGLARGTLRKRLATYGLE